MSNSENIPSFARQQYAELNKRLRERRKCLQVITGARQVGKTTLVQQVTSKLTLPVHFVSADEPMLRGVNWLSQQWEIARLLAEPEGAILVVDEIQKIEQWSETVKRLWDEDSRKKRQLKVILLGSAPLLVQRGLTESLAGRFETLHLPHWSFVESCRHAHWTPKVCWPSREATRFQPKITSIQYRFANSYSRTFA